MDTLLQDLRYALRSLRRAPAFTSTTVLVLGLGIGVATAMFSVFDKVLLRKLPVVDQDRIVMLSAFGRGAAAEELPINLDQLRHFRDATRTVVNAAGVAYYGVEQSPISERGHALALNQARVTENFFEVLGARPVVGRMFRAEDDVTGAAPVMVISYDLWRRQFAGDSGVIGRQLHMSGFDWDYTIVGVAPMGLDYPLGVDYWIPIVPTRYSLVDVVARLAPGSTSEMARTEFLAFLGRDPEFADRGHHGARVRPLSEMVVGNVRPALLALTVAVGLLLLLVCVNVGNLFLLRTAARSRDVAIRRALGAGSTDIMRQILVEVVALALLSGVLGVVLAQGLLRALVLLAPPGLPRLDLIRLGGAPFAIAAAVTVVTLLLAGLIPAATAGKQESVDSLRFDHRAGTEGKRQRRVRRGLVASQVALALIVLSGAGLLVQTFARLDGLDLGYRADHLSIVQVALPWGKYASACRGRPPTCIREKTLAVHEELVPRFQALPGVAGVSPILYTPFSGSSIWMAQFLAEGQSQEEGQSAPFVSVEAVGADFFRTLGLPLVRGRAFTDTDRDGAPKVAVVSEAVARRLWPGADPVGKRIHFPGEDSPDSQITVVGVAGDLHYREHRTATPTVYLPYRQLRAQGFFAIRTRGNVGAVVPAMRRIVREVEADALVWKAQTMDDLMAAPLAQPRLNALLLSTFALTALMLAAIGLYGIMASAVRQRTRELGVRVALGATPNQIRDLVLGEALAIAGLGAVAGLAGVAASSRFIRALLFQVSPTDPVTLGVVCGVLLGVGLLAAYIPARRAARVDPMVALRNE
jgi:putative ABC transport system permease protein